MKNILVKLGDKYGSFLIIFFLIAINLFLFALPLLQIGITIPKNYNEGWNAYQAAHAFSNEPLYPDLKALFSNNYPPLSFYIVGSLGLLIDDNIVAGRIIALISLLIVATTIGLITRKLSDSSFIALFSSLFFLAYVGGNHYEMVAMNDPQILAHAFQMIGFLIFLFSNQKGKPLIFSLLLIFIGGFIKHNLLALPIAITIWLFFNKRRSFYVWVIASVILFLVSLVGLELMYGSNFFTSLLAAPRHYWIGNVASKLQLWFTPILLLLAFGLVLFLSNYGNRQVQLIAIYVFLAGFWGVYVWGGDGTGPNAIFDLIIGLTLASALAIYNLGKLSALSKVYRRTLFKPNFLQIIAMLILLLSVLVIIPQRGIELLTYLVKSEARTIIAEDIDFIAAHKGKAICESLALCYWAGKPFTVDLFNLGQKLGENTVPEEEFTKLIKNHDFAVIQFDNPNGTTRIPESVNQQIFANYKIERVSPQSGVFLLPKVKK
ncbi:hypothetical protein STA3757_43550 [Stanieria sp. NIES-3757]|nr:hypothetical protein STA3757_43550 [Stanieria sp. NIES-3757]